MPRSISPQLITALQSTPLWISCLEPDCRSQKVFLAIRDEMVDFYYQGGRLFSFDGKNFRTHIKYAAAIESNGNAYLTEREFQTKVLPPDFVTNYKRIQENCANYSGFEAQGVAALYHTLSFLAGLPGFVVLDIEVTFKSLSDKGKQDRIDTLLMNASTGELLFVEAKEYSNKELWSTTTPDVVHQIARYEAQIAKNAEQIVTDYQAYVQGLNAIFGLNMPLPQSVLPKVTLLIFGFDSDQRNGRLKSLILSNPAYATVNMYAIGDITLLDLNRLKKA